MPTPEDPENDSAGSEIPEQSADNPPPVPPEPSAEDAIWNAIVQNYGDRAEIDEPEVQVPPSLRDLPPTPDEEDDEPAEAGDVHDHFVPPVPPPLPTPPPARLLAWVGLFGVPMFVLVALVAGIAVPSWLGLLLMAWFVGGFVFLVASMRPGPGGDHDDGARL